MRDILLRPHAQRCFPPASPAPTPWSLVVTCVFDAGALRGQRLRCVLMPPLARAGVHLRVRAILFEGGQPVQRLVLISREGLQETLPIVW
eukprot:1607539-Pyramimonas_sp.AAC.1